jgi:hypothetical protein
MPESNNLSRLTNLVNAFEGTSLPPKPSGGRRIPVISALRVIRNESVFGGANVTLAWMQEELLETDSLELFVFGDSRIFTSSSVNPRDAISKPWLNTAPIINGYKVSSSPLTIFIPAMYKIPVTIGIATRHSSGMLSDPEFLSVTTTTIDPGTTVIDYQTNGSEITLDGTDKVMYSTIIRANTIGQGKGIKINWGTDHTTGTAGTVYKIWWGAVYAQTTESLGGRLFSEALVMNDPSKVNAQKFIQLHNVFYGGAIGVPWDNLTDNFQTAAEDTTNAVTVKLTVNGPNTQGLTPLYWLITKV